jgi:K+-sensing histidine kinase KdpD
VLTDGYCHVLAGRSFWLSHVAGLGLSLDTSRWARWATVLLVTAAMTALEMILIAIMEQGALLPPVAAVAIATLVGGRRPGLLALALNLVIAEYIAIPPHYELVLPWPKGVISMTTFVVVAGIAWYSAVLFRDELVAVRERDELMATSVPTATLLHLRRHRPAP